MKNLVLKWNRQLKCYVDKNGNVWVKDLEPGYKLRAEIERLERQLQEYQR